MMNKSYYIALFLLILVFGKTYTNTHVISVGGMTFAPTPTSATVGDTIKLVWGNGIHTTTSTTVPAGALTWNAPIDSAHTSFKYVVLVSGQYSYWCSYHYLFGMIGAFSVNPVGITNISGSTPEEFGLYQNYPNPFNPSTNIKFDVSEKSAVKLTIYDVIGGEVKTLVKGELAQGSYSVNWDASESPSGIYFYKLETPGFTKVRKMILVK